MKKLLFSHPKCKHLHVGEECPFCPILEAHGQDILKSMQEKYLGDLIGDTIIGDGCNEKNITNRRNKGLGLVAQIMSMLETVSLGHYLFETAMQLRESIFINGILFNSEVWYSLNKKQIKVLEDVDKLLLRRVLQTPVSTPSEALYLETGAIPISFILKGRRIMYLYYSLQLEECEMLSYSYFDFTWVLAIANIFANLGIFRPMDKRTSKRPFPFPTFKRPFPFPNLAKNLLSCCHCTHCPS